MEEISWGVPAQRTRKEEKFKYSVVTMNALEKAGSNRKFSFNKAAIEELGLVGGESQLSVGYNTKENRVFIRVGDGFQVAKNNSFSDKKTFEYIAKLLNLDVNVENNLEVVVQDNPTIFELILIDEKVSYISDPETMYEAVEIPAEEMKAVVVEEFNNPLHGLRREVEENVLGLEDEILTEDKDITESPFELNAKEEITEVEVIEEKEDEWS
jgi:hypothetical protein